MSLASWGAGVRGRAARIMADSRERVREHGASLTPVRTGRMREHLRQTPTEGGLGYVVGWVKEDFTAVAQPFYPALVVLGTRHMAGRDPITPALEAERPVLLRAFAAGLVR